MCQAGLALEEERAALGRAAVGTQILYFPFAVLILFRCLQALCIVCQKALGF